MAEYDAQPGLETYRYQRVIVLVIDVVESVAAMETDEASFIDRWRAFVDDVRRNVLPRHGGMLVKSLGDGLLVRFEQAVPAVTAALAMLEHPRLVGTEGNGARLQLRAAAHYADVVVDEIDIYGTGVNLTARLATLAAPGDLVISEAFRKALGVDARWQTLDLGECFLKHVAKPVRAFRIPTPTVAPGSHNPRPPPLWLTVAVLSFAAPQRLPLEDGASEALVAAFNGVLGTLPGLQVLSRLSTRAAASDRLALNEVGLRLGAAYVVRGVIAGQMPIMQVQCELIDTRIGQVVWTDGAAVDIQNLFAGQDGGFDRLAAGICRALLRTETRLVGLLPLPTLDSYTLYVGGAVMLHQMRRDDFARCREIFEALHERHPRAGAPLAMQALWHLYRLLQGWSEDWAGDGRRGMDLARRALAVQPDHALALAIDGALCAHVLDDLKLARERAESALAADPQEPQAWLTLASVDSYEAMGDAATVHAERAIALSPLDPCRFVFDLMHGAAHLAAGRARQAVGCTETSLRANALHAPTHRLRVIALEMDGRPQEAQAAAAELLRVDPGFRVGLFAQRYPGRQHAHAARYIQALQLAGLPP